MNLPSLCFPGPWPRELTEDEINDAKTRAMIQIGELIEQGLRGRTFCLGDSVTSHYTITCGTPTERRAAKQNECGAISPLGGPPCRLDKGHNCQHSSVTRW